MTSTGWANVSRAMILAVLSHGLFGCGDSATGAGPHVLSPTPPTSPTATAAPTMTAISPTAGATGGDTGVQISGTGFLVGSVVTIGEFALFPRFDPRTPGVTMYVETPAHPAGTVDVVVTNPDGQSARLAGAYTYAPASSFDLNGRWWAFGNAGQDIPIEFVIQNGVLMTVACDSATLTFSPGIPVRDGEFAIPARDDGIVFSGRAVGKDAAVGDMHFAPCTSTRWRGEKY
jgi:hypothetical protein